MLLRTLYENLSHRKQRNTRVRPWRMAYLRRLRHCIADRLGLIYLPRTNDRRSIYVFATGLWRSKFPTISGTDAPSEWKAPSILVCTPMNRQTRKARAHSSIARQLIKSSMNLHPLNFSHN